MHHAIRQALAPFAPKQSTVQFTEEELLAADVANNVNKAERAQAEQEARAMRLQMQDVRPALDSGISA